jgi:hypothetical protein
MSLGPGYWQRVLLDYLSAHEVFAVHAAAREHLMREPVPAEWALAWLAAKRLARFGKARALYVPQCELCGRLASALEDCPACRRSDYKRVLVLTRAGGIGSVIKAMLPPSRPPTWFSFAGWRAGRSTTG